MRTERGSAALLGLIMMMLLGSMGATLLMLSKTDLQIAANHRDGMGAQYLAEAGIQHAVAKLRTDEAFISQTEMNNHEIISQSLVVMPTTGHYAVQTGPDPKATSTRIRLVTATGTLNQARREIVAQVTLPTPPGVASPVIIIWNY